MPQKSKLTFADCDQNENSIEQINDALQRLARGELETRLVHTDSFGSHATLARNINDYTDKVETFFREAIGRLRDFGNGNYEARIDPRGFDNAFLNTIQMFNENLEEEKRQRQKQEKVVQALNESVKELNGSVAFLQSTAKDLSGIASETKSNASNALSESERVAKDSKAAAERCEDLSLSIEYISSQVTEANKTICDFLDAFQSNLSLLEHLKDNEKVNPPSSAPVDLDDEDEAKTKKAEALEALERANSVIEYISYFSQAVASSTVEQRDATSVIHNSIEEISKESNLIREQLERVQGEANQNSKLSNNVLGQSSSLVKVAQRLDELAKQLES